MTLQRGGFYLLLGATAVLLVTLIGFIFLGTPQAQAAAGGLAQKIFYFHVPAAYAMYLCGTVSFAASIAYFLREGERSNALAHAGAECAVLFGVLVLTSGPLWAKKAWGVYWTWEPRLVTSLFSVLIYAAIVVLRAFSGEGGAERRFAAAMGILGWFNLWIIHFSVRLWGGNHPTVVGRGGGGLKDPRMVTALLWGFLAMTLLAAVLLWLRTRLKHAESRLAQVRQGALTSGILESA